VIVRNSKRNMNKPYSISEHPYLNQEEKEKFTEIMLDWACFYETVSWGDVHISAVREKLGIFQKDFEELIELHRNMDILDCVKKAWIYGKRPLTVKEICAILGNKFSETNIRKQVIRLSKHGYLKKKEVKIFGKIIDFYYAESTEKE